jgi:2-phospho-L-lactate transferase/gluconeogenesis factor (CofD/UPF0052 family)
MIRPTIRPTIRPAEALGPLWAELRRWLQPGVRVKRWVAVYLAALVLVAFGLELILVQLSRTAPGAAQVSSLTLQLLPDLTRGLAFVAVGGLLMGWAVLGLTGSLLGGLPSQHRGRAETALIRRRALGRGPKVVAIGGGTGLSTLLRGLKEHTSNITAVVTVCDDGGSSGRLRRDLRVLPPGDFRQCIAALSDADPLVRRLLEHRFHGEGSDLAGHAFGNLLIAALVQITGSFDRALQEASRVLAVRGRVLPSTLDDLALCAELVDSSTVRGESRIPEAVAGTAPGRPHGAPEPPARLPDAGTGEVASGAGRATPIRRVFLEPDRPQAFPEVIRSLLDADLIVIGPGSLYTSILPNLLVDDVARALCWSRAVKIYVCNVAAEPGETDGYEVQDYVRAIHAHLLGRLGFPFGGSSQEEEPNPAPFTHVLVNETSGPAAPTGWDSPRPGVDAEALAGMGVQVIAADVADEAQPARHDPQKLGRVLLDALAGRPAAVAARSTASNGRLRGWWPFSPEPLWREPVGSAAD